MSSRPRGRNDNTRPEHPGPALSPEVIQYAMALSATGMEPREVTRAAFYAEEYGLDVLRGDGCVFFTKPSCGDWSCLNPAHQRLERE